VATGEPVESSTLEFKLSASSRVEGERETFLGAVCAYANGSGGDVVFGIREEDGKPVELVGVADIDQETLRIDNIIRSGIEPPLSSFEVRRIVVGETGVVLVRVGTSWRRPHRLVRSRHFYGRTSAGNYPLSMQEVRALFLASDFQLEAARSDRLARVAAITRGDTGIPLKPAPKIVMHITPSVEARFSGRELEAHADKLSPLVGDAGGLSVRRELNFDGLLAATRHDYIPGNTFVSYVQLFRDGRIEAVDAFTLEGRDTLNGTGMDRLLVEGVRKYVAILRSFRVNPPVLVFVSLLDIKGFRILIDDRFLDPHARPIDRGQLLPTETVIESYDEPVDPAMRPICDQIWNAVGVMSSPSFLESGLLK
jgi:hypothetical protein